MTNANDTPLDVAAIAARVEAIHGFGYVHYSDSVFTPNTLIELDKDGGWKHWDLKSPYSTEACEFIAHAPADIRALLAERERLLAENARLREALGDIRNELTPGAPCRLSYIEQRAVEALAAHTESEAHDAAS